MQDGFLRAAAASIPVAVADPRRNAAAICARIDQAHRAHAALLVLPELCVTGYTCGDLFLSALLLDAAEEALVNICAHTQNCDPVVVLGVPLRAGGKLYNCAAVLHRGRILGIVPKTWLPNYDVFAEKRCFTSAAAYSGPGCVPVGGQDAPFGTGLVFACAQMPVFRLGVELCEDVWAPVPPSVRLCLAGATVIANCSASPEAAGKPAHRRTLLRAASARGLCGYVYANAGPDESTARAVFSAHHLIAENGTILAEHAPFAPESGLLMTELDLLTLTAERRRNTTFVPEGEGVRVVTFSMPLRPTPLGRAVSPHPFVPDDAEQRTKRAELLLTMQAHGLRKRLLHTGSRAALLPVTDDADSVLALLVRWLIAAEAERAEEPLRTELRAALSAPDADCAGVSCALTDFCFYHLVRCGAHPRRILRLARAAFGGAAADTDILRAMAALTRCLFRRPAALPDHVTLGSGAQALRWPPDAAGSLWLDEIDALRRELS